MPSLPPNVSQDQNDVDYDPVRTMMVPFGLPRALFLNNVECRVVFYEDYPPGKLTVAVSMSTDESTI